ncbi:MAG: hypothetical protein NC087_07495 [Anaeroplasma bactoclasticum]|nr:hypothetical protein [Anaeroplasma bactoclasticum]MCM1557363.1 hypothetical protein [Anaeroplasma bactoclasticum]
MKKLVFGITSLMFILLVTIWVLSKGKTVTEKDQYFTIPRILTYHYDEDKRMSFEIFINNENSLIEFPLENSYFLVNNNSSYQLKDIEVSKKKNTISKEDIFYKYTITSSLLNVSKDDMVFDSCSLRIKNDAFTLECLIGYVGIYRKDYPKLDFTDLYGNYAYMDGELHLVGITIQLNADYKSLENVQIGSAFVPLRYIEEDVLYDSERTKGSLKHSVIATKEVEKIFLLEAKQNYYFLPISYSNLQLFTSGCILITIDGETHYIEDFTYLANDIYISDYNQTKKEGKIEYA